MTKLADTAGLINSGPWAWLLGDDETTLLIRADDQKEAYRKAIAYRLEHCNDTTAEAVVSFEENDTLVQIGGLCETEPYEGDDVEPYWHCQVHGQEWFRVVGNIQR